MHCARTLVSYMASLFPSHEPNAQFEIPPVRITMLARFYEHMLYASRLNMLALKTKMESAPPAKRKKVTKPIGPDEVTNASTSASALLTPKRALIADTDPQTSPSGLLPV